jgi:uncharacterized membrane protein YkoI
MTKTLTTVLAPRLARSVVILTAAIAGSSLPAFAQPADRPAAFLSAVNTAIANAPASPTRLFYEAELVNDGGTWIFDVEVATPNASSVSEFEIHATTFAILDSETNAPSASKQAKILGIFNLLPQSTTSLAQAITIITPYTPDGSVLRKVEMDIQNAHAAYEFEFISADGQNVQKLKVDAVTGAASGDSGGGGGGGGGPLPGATTLAQANQIALALYPNGKLIETEYDSDRNLWEVRLNTAMGEARKIKIDAATGAVLEDNADHRSSEDRAEDRLKLNGAGSASITLAQAMQFALAAAPGSTPVKAEWEFEHGVLIAKVIVQETAGLRTFLFNATTGAAITPTPPTPPVADPAAMLSVARASELAVIAVPGAVAIEAEYETQGGRPFYEVKVINTNPLRLRKVIIDGRTSAVWDITVLPMSTAFIARVQQILTRVPAITKTFRQAQNAALATLGDGQVRSIELEPEGSGLSYHIKVLIGEKTFELSVNPNTLAVKPK